MYVRTCKAGIYAGRNWWAPLVNSLSLIFLSFLTSLLPIFSLCNLKTEVEGFMECSHCTWAWVQLHLRPQWFLSWHFCIPWYITNLIPLECRIIMFSLYIHVHVRTYMYVVRIYHFCLPGCVNVYVRTYVHAKPVSMQVKTGEHLWSTLFLSFSLFFLSLILHLYFPFSLQYFAT